MGEWGGVEGLGFRLRVSSLGFRVFGVRKKVRSVVEGDTRVVQNLPNF